MPEENATSPLKGKTLLLGVTGSIAAYKTASLVRLFKKAGASVQVLMTHDAQRFITPLTLGTLSENEVLTDVFPENTAGSWTKHIQLGITSDLFIIAPGTAHSLANLAHGACSSMLTAVALAARCPIHIYPAMDHDMYVHPATQANLKTLNTFGYTVFQPEHGELASGLIGEGRLPEPEQIFENTTQFFKPNTALKGKKVVITAGPTREPLDPVRFITNHSTGTMGYKLATVAKTLGASVYLISGPSHLTPPQGIHFEAITTAAEMYQSVQKHIETTDILIMAAAVADYTPTSFETHKIKKRDDDLVLPLKRTIDILATIGKQKKPHQQFIGFALETGDGLAKAKAKLVRKNLDWIVLNDLHEPGAGFGETTNTVTMIHKEGGIAQIPVASKLEVAKDIWKHLLS